MGEEKAPAYLAWMELPIARKKSAAFSLHGVLGPLAPETEPQLVRILRCDAFTNFRQLYIHEIRVQTSNFNSFC